MTDLKYIAQSPVSEEKENNTVLTEKYDLAISRPSNILALNLTKTSEIISKVTDLKNIVQSIVSKEKESNIIIAEKYDSVTSKPNIPTLNLTKSSKMISKTSDLKTIAQTPVSEVKEKNTVDVVNLISDDDDSDGDVQFISKTYVYTETSVDPLSSYASKLKKTRPCSVAVEKLDLKILQDNINKEAKAKKAMIESCKRRKVCIFVERLPFWDINTNIDIDNFCDDTETENTTKEYTNMKDYIHNRNSDIGKSFENKYVTEVRLGQDEDINEVNDKEEVVFLSSDHPQLKYTGDIPGDKMMSETRNTKELNEGFEANIIVKNDKLDDVHRPQTPKFNSSSITILKSENDDYHDNSQDLILSPLDTNPVTNSHICKDGYKYHTTSSIITNPLNTINETNIKEKLKHICNNSLCCITTKNKSENDKSNSMAPRPADCPELFDNDKNIEAMCVDVDSVNTLVNTSDNDNPVTDKTFIENKDIKPSIEVKKEITEIDTKDNMDNTHYGSFLHNNNINTSKDCMANNTSNLNIVNTLDSKMHIDNIENISNSEHNSCQTEENIQIKSKESAQTTVKFTKKSDKTVNDNSNLIELESISDKINNMDGGLSPNLKNACENGELTVAVSVPVCDIDEQNSCLKQSHNIKNNFNLTCILSCKDSSHSNVELSDTKRKNSKVGNTTGETGITSDLNTSIGCTNPAVETVKESHSYNNAFNNPRLFKCKEDVNSNKPIPNLECFVNKVKSADISNLNNKNAENVSILKYDIKNAGVLKTQEFGMEDCLSIIFPATSLTNNNDSHTAENISKPELGLNNVDVITEPDSAVENVHATANISNLVCDDKCVHIQENLPNWKCVKNVVLKTRDSGINIDHSNSELDINDFEVPATSYSSNADFCTGESMSKFVCGGNIVDILNKSESIKEGDHATKPVSNVECYINDVKMPSTLEISNKAAKKLLNLKCDPNNVNLPVTTDKRNKNLHTAEKVSKLKCNVNNGVVSKPDPKDGQNLEKLSNFECTLNTIEIPATSGLSNADCHTAESISNSKFSVHSTDIPNEPDFANCSSECSTNNVKLSIRDCHSVENKSILECNINNDAPKTSDSTSEDSQIAKNSNNLKSDVVTIKALNTIDYSYEDVHSKKSCIVNIVEISHTPEFNKDVQISRLIDHSNKNEIDAKEISYFNEFKKNQCYSESSIVSKALDIQNANEFACGQSNQENFAEYADTNSVQVDFILNSEDSLKTFSATSKLNRNNCKEFNYNSLSSKNISIDTESNINIEFDKQLCNIPFNQDFNFKSQSKEENFLNSITQKEEFTRSLIHMDVENLTKSKTYLENSVKTDIKVTSNISDSGDNNLDSDASQTSDKKVNFNECLAESKDLNEFYLKNFHQASDNTVNQKCVLKNKLDSISAGSSLSNVDSESKEHLDVNLSHKSDRQINSLNHIDFLHVEEMNGSNKDRNYVSHVENINDDKYTDINDNGNVLKSDDRGTSLDKIHEIDSLFQLALQSLKMHSDKLFHSSFKDTNSNEKNSPLLLNGIANESKYIPDHSYNVLSKIRTGDQYIFGDEELTVFGIYDPKSPSTSDTIKGSDIIYPDSDNSYPSSHNTVNSENESQSSCSIDIDSQKSESVYDAGVFEVNSASSDAVCLKDGDCKAKRKSNEHSNQDISTPKKTRNEPSFSEHLENLNTQLKTNNFDSENKSEFIPSTREYPQEKSSRYKEIHSPIFFKNFGDSAMSQTESGVSLQNKKGFSKGSGSNHGVIYDTFSVSADHLPDCNIVQPPKNYTNGFKPEHMKISLSKMQTLINKTQNKWMKHYSISRVKNNIVLNKHLQNALRELSMNTFIKPPLTRNKTQFWNINQKNILYNVPGMDGFDLLDPPKNIYTVNVVQVGQPPTSSQNQIPASCEMTESQTVPRPMEDQSHAVTFVDLTPNSSDETITAVEVDIANSLKDSDNATDSNETNLLLKKRSTVSSVASIKIETESMRTQENVVDMTYKTETSDDINRGFINSSSAKDGPNKLIQIISSTQAPTNFILKTDDASQNSLHTMYEDGRSVQFVTPMTASNLNANKAQTLVNLLTQKIPKHSSSTEAQTLTVNTYSKCNPVAGYSIQHALAQILSPQINQAGVNDCQQSIAGAPQVLHIVQGKSAITTNHNINSLTMGDGNQQSAIINAANSTQVLHILQSKNSMAQGIPASDQSPNQTAIGSLSFVESSGQATNQVFHILNAGAQAKTNSTAQLLKRVNLLTSITNAQGGNEQKMVQFVCKSSDGKAIQLNPQHSRGMVLRLQPIETPATPQQSQKTDDQNINVNNDTLMTTADPPQTEAAPIEIKSRSMYEENYAKFIQGPSRIMSPEKSTSLPKFNQAFGKSAFQDDSLGKDIDDDNLESPSTPITSVPQETNILENSDNTVNMTSIGQLHSPPLLLKKSPHNTVTPQSLIQQLKQSMAPMNIQTMHGGVIYTRQIPVNIGGGQTINLITVPSTEILDESTKSIQDIKQECLPEQPVIRIIPQEPSQTSQVDNGTDESQTGYIDNNSQNQGQPVVTQMRIKLPMLSKGPHVAHGTRVVRPVLQIQRNVIPGGPSVYQQLVLTAAPSMAQQTIRLPQPIRQTFQRLSTPAHTESNMSSSTLEQLREFDMVLEQVKERSTVQPGTTINPVNHFSQAQTISSVIDTSSQSVNTSREVLYSIGSNQTLNVTYVNQKLISTTPVIAATYRSPASPATSNTPQTSPQIQLSQSIPNSPITNQAKTVPSASKLSSKSIKKSSKPSNISTNNSSKSAPVPSKTAIQKPLEDEQTTQRILYILAEYKEQVENSPDKDKPAPRRRSNPPTNPSTSSKRKKSSSSKKNTSGQSHQEMSPVGGNDDPNTTMGSEDSSCGFSQGECSDLGAQSLENQSPQGSPQKAVRKLVFQTQETEQPVLHSSNPPQRNVIITDGQAIAMARQNTGKGTTAVLMPGNYLLPVSMVKSGHQITIVTNQGPKLLTVPQGEAGTTNTVFLQRLISPTGLKPMIRPGQVRHVRLPASSVQNLHTLNLSQSGVGSLSTNSSQSDTISWINSTAGITHAKMMTEYGHIGIDAAPDSVVSESSDAPSLKGDDNASTGGESVQVNDNNEFSEDLMPTNIGQSTPDEGIFSNATNSPAMTPRSSDSQIPVSRSPSSNATVNLIQVQTADGTQPKLFQVQNPGGLTSLIQLAGKNSTSQTLQHIGLQGGCITQDSNREPQDTLRNIMFVRKPQNYDGQFSLEPDKIQTVIESGQSMKLLPSLVARCAPGAIITMHRAPQPVIDEISGQQHEKATNKDVADGNTPWRFISTTGETVNIVSSGGPPEPTNDGANRVAAAYSAFMDSPSDPDQNGQIKREQFSPEPTTQQLFDKMFVSCDSKKTYVGEISSDSSRVFPVDEKSYQMTATAEPKQLSISPSPSQQSHSSGFTVHHHNNGSAATVSHGQLVSSKSGSSSQQAHTLRHKYALLEQELRLQKSLSEECEDLGVDSPSASELFPEAELLFAPTSPATSLPLPTMSEHQHNQAGSPHSSNLTLGSSLTSQVTGEVKHEEFARSHPNTTFSTHPALEVQSYASAIPVHIPAKAPSQHTDLERLISSINSEDDNSQPSKVALNRFDQILGDSDDISMPRNVAQVIRRADKHGHNGSSSYDPSSGSILKSIIEREHNCSSPEQHGELFWDSNSNSNQSESVPQAHHAIDFSSEGSEKCCKSPGHSYDETNSTDSSIASREPVRLNSVIKSSSVADCAPILTNALIGNSSPDTEMDSGPLLRTYAVRKTRAPSVSPRSLSNELNAGTEIETSSSEDKSALKSGLLMHHRLESDSSTPGSPLTPQIKEDESSSGPGRRASLRGVVKRGCHCCNGSPAPPRPKKPRFRFDATSRSRKSPESTKRARSPNSIVSS